MRFAIPLLLLQLVCSAAIDTVVLANGDRISGEVQKIDGGKLSLKTEYAGTVEISWSKVARVDSEKTYEIEAESGWRLRGTLLRSQNGVSVSTEAGTFSVEPGRLVRATPVSESRRNVWQAIDGTADLGYSFARGNVGLSQSSLNVNGHYRRDGYKIQLELDSLFARQEGASTASRHSGNVRFDRYLSQTAFLYSMFGMERDERRSLNLRTQAGGGLGWKMIKSADRELSLLGGVNYVNEQFRTEAGLPGPPSASGEGQFGLDWRTVTPLGVQLGTKIELTPNIVQLGRYRFGLETGARVPLIGRYVWSFNFFNRYDSRPPVEAQKTDYGAISSLGVTF